MTDSDSPAIAQAQALLALLEAHKLLVAAGVQCRHVDARAMADPSPERLADCDAATIGLTLAQDYATTAVTQYAETMGLVGRVTA